MRKIPALAAFLSIIILFTSCQKELSEDALNGSGGGTGTGGGGTNNSNIIGDWDFVGMDVHTSSTVNINAGGMNAKTITTSDYLTKDNTGTLKITSNEMIFTGLAYSVDTTMHVKSYMDGLLVDESDLPFVMSIPATSGTSTYVRNNNDSLTITNSISNAPGISPPGPTGARLSWAGDTLLMRTIGNYSVNTSQGGLPATVVSEFNSVSKFKRR